MLYGGFRSHDGHFLGTPQKFIQKVIKKAFSCHGFLVPPYEPGGVAAIAKDWERVLYGTAVARMPWIHRLNARIETANRLR